MKRRFHTIMLAGAATLALTAPAPALAQDIPRSDRMRELKNEFGDDGDAYLEAQLAARRCNADDLRRQIIRLENMGERARQALRARRVLGESSQARQYSRFSTRDLERLLRSYEGRLAAARQLQLENCPQGESQEGVPQATSPLPPPVQDRGVHRTAIERLWRAVLRECDPTRFDVAKANLVRAIEAAMRDELARPSPSDSELAYLDEQMRRARLLQRPSCDADGILEETAVPPPRAPRRMTPDEIAEEVRHDRAVARRERLLLRRRRAELEHQRATALLIDIFFSWGQTDQPVTGGGFVDRDGAERLALPSPRTVDYVSGNAFLGFILGRTPVMLRARYGEGNGADSFDIEPGVRSGHPYAALSPGGSTGISATEGYAGTSAVNVSDISLGGSIGLVGRPLPAFDLPIHTGLGAYRSWDNPADGFASDSLPGPSVSFWLDYRHSDRDYDTQGGASGTTAGGFAFNFSQERRFSLDEDYVTAGFSAALGHALGDGVLVSAGAGAAAYYRRSRLDFRERNIANFGPAADQDFTILVEDEDDGIGFRGDAGAALSFRLGSRSVLTLFGSGSWLSEVGAPLVPLTGDAVLAGETVRLGTEDSWSWGVGAGLTLRFGGD